jgi:hypothetical protein
MRLKPVHGHSSLNWGNQQIEAFPRDANMVKCNMRFSPAILCRIPNFWEIAL